MNYHRGYPDDAIELDAGLAGPSEGGLGLRALMTFVWRSRWLILVGAIVGLMLSLVQIASMKATYTASATVLFKPEQRNIVDLQDVLTRPANDDLRNQVEILRSKTLMSRVVDRLTLTEWPDFNPDLRGEEGWASSLQRLADSRTYVPWDTLADLGIISLPPAPTQLSEAEIADARKVVARDILVANLKIEPVPNSRVIRLSITLSRPAAAARVANAVAQEYITAQLDASLAATREATIWLSDRVEELKTELATAEAAVTTYRAELAERTGQTAAVLQQQLNSLNTALAVASARTASANIRHQQAREAMRNPGRISVVSDFQNSEVLTDARAKERELQTDRAELSRLVPKGHDRLRLLDLRIEGQEAEIRNEAERIVRSLFSEYRAANDQEIDLRKQVTTLEQRLQAQEVEEVRLRQLEREAQASQLIYQNFLGRLKETTQQQKLEEADAVILSPAEAPGAADSASKKRIALMGLILGGGLGLGVSFLHDRLNNTFRSVEEVEEATGLQVLGTVPSVAKSRERRDVLRYVLDKPSSSLAEAIRSLRTSLLFSQVDEPPQVVMFTSTVPLEGKSTTSLLLALTSAQMGKSAIIVDCDLRRPSLSAFLGERTRRTAGLRGVLDGSLSLTEATVVDPATGLSILSSQPGEGTVINAADVLSSDRFGQLLEDLRTRYALVILDAPPTLSVTDARVIAQRVDATLYCVRWDSTPRDAVAEGLREFRIVRPRIAGVVVTMVDADHTSRYGYRAYGGLYRGKGSDPYHAN